MEEEGTQSSAVASIMNISLKKKVQKILTSASSPCLLLPVWCWESAPIRCFEWLRHFSDTTKFPLVFFMFVACVWFRPLGSVAALIIVVAGCTRGLSAIRGNKRQLHPSTNVRLLCYLQEGTRLSETEIWLCFLNVDSQVLSTRSQCGHVPWEEVCILLFFLTPCSGAFPQRVLALHFWMNIVFPPSGALSIFPFEHPMKDVLFSWSTCMCLH